MSNLLIAVDPDSKKHGIAIYVNGKLERLSMMSLMDLMDYIDIAKATTDHNIDIAIEDVMANKFTYKRNKKGIPAVQTRVDMSTGRCQQAQVEVERMAAHIGVKVTKYPPMIGNWADPKMTTMFQRATGWRNKSNPDTRSAAFFGFIHLKVIA